MFKNVVVGVDGAANGYDAIALGTRLTEPDGRLTLVHVHGGELNPSHALVPGYLEAERDASMKLLRQGRDAAQRGAELVSVVAMSVGRALHVQAEEGEADLIVVGSCERGLIGRTVLGDDTRAALMGAPCAVAIASSGYAEHPVPFANVGVAYDESPESDAALALAREIAAPTRATVRALEVLALPSYPYTGLAVMAGADLDVVLGEANDRLAELPGVDARAVFGLAGEALASFSEQVDILVTGSRGYGPARRLMFGSTTRYLERHSRCSLLVLPRGVRPAHAPTRAGAGDDRLVAQEHDGALA